MSKVHVIYRGCHRPFPFKIMGLRKADIYTVREFEFTNSCRYQLSNEDQYDWNKLYGVTFGMFNIHKYSVRFVWRYDPMTDKIHTAAYWYIDGIRNYQILGSIDLNKAYKFKLEIHQDHIRFVLLDDYIKITEYSLYVDPSIISKSKYQSGLYFGGNNVAPKKIKIKEY